MEDKRKMDDLDSKNSSSNSQSNNNLQQNLLDYLDSDLLLLLIILFIFFQNTDVFSKHLNFLTTNIKKVKKYLDAADATLQAIDQASHVPEQMLD
ncbi:hypothetical protein MWH28_04775 [Natroniella sulfidigena]|uniref:hypothetical protein n=1 Tax=Natroniella sulfidigena TaxID=723921 RepID=UPI00200B0931|nr:hypothetical protein [Natroniella sulfidigena]MCK8816685.1 hypothetical protein [Natroniella sulfidigena]